MNRVLFPCLAIGLLLSTQPGCKPASKDSGVPAPKADYVDVSISAHRNLGWIGATSNPVGEPISLPDPDDAESMVSPGAIVLREVMKNQAAAEAGLRVGDVVVRVGDEWLPINDDPTLDFLAQLEEEVASGAKEIAVGILRGGKYRSLSIPSIQGSLDEGLPTSVARIDQATDLALQRLAGEQKDDGSFGDAPIASQRLGITALVGLAFLASADQRWDDTVDKGIEFVAAEVDALSTANTPAPAKQATGEDSKSPTLQMQIPAVDLEPLAASYVLQFLGESKVHMLDPAWMKRIMGLVSGVTQAQTESGGWNTTETTDSTDSLAVDVIGTHTTNQVVLAIGVWERKGVLSQGDSLTRACEFLKRQAEARSVQSLDRRTKAALSAGTAAALIAINCTSSDPFLKQMSDECLARCGDMQSAPSLPLPGLLSTAVVARAAGNETWIRFHSGAKIGLMSAQSPDGAFHLAPRNKRQETIEVEDDPHWSAAHFTLVLAMQRGNLQRTLGNATMPMQVARDSSGNATAAAGHAPLAVPGGFPAGNVIKLELNGEGSIEDQIKAKLKEQGIDSSKIEFGTLPGGHPPAAAGKKNKAP